MRPLPRPLDFAIVGAAKCGTSSLAALLEQHPDIHLLKPKDGHYFSDIEASGGWKGPGDDVFNDQIRVAKDAYGEQLRQVGTGKKVGEASVFYLVEPAALDELRRNLAPEAPVIAVLRRPDDRAFSSYMHTVREGLETGTFADSMAKESERRAAGWQPIWWLRECGSYAGQVARLHEIFGRDRVFVIRYEDLTQRPREALTPVLDHLGLPPIDVPLTHLNASGIPRSRAVHRFMTGPNRLRSVAASTLPRALRLRIRSRVAAANLKRSSMPADARKMLMNEYAEDIGRLEELTGLDLNAWRELPRTP